jgi:2,3-diaminopropionate biosynthesis protein SbnA
MRFESPLELMLGNVFATVSGVLPDTPVHLKLEGFNMAGSIKLKPAIQMIEDLEREGVLRPGKRVIESSSGNLGVALSLVCRVKGYPFVCVSDPNLAQHNRRLIEAYGGRVVIADARDHNDGYLQSRINLITRWLAEDPTLVWTNQYANLANKAAHIRWTGPEILAAFPALDVLVIGAGTTGTLMGCAEYVRRAAPNVRIVAVDAEGSVTFGFRPQKRYIPGLGTSRRPELADETLVDQIMLVPEIETIKMCQWLLDTHGWLLGGSTGTVLAGVRRIADQIPSGSTVVTVSPDLGERYLEMIYSRDWVARNYPHAIDRLTDVALSSLAVSAPGATA